MNPESAREQLEAGKLRGIPRKIVAAVLLGLGWLLLGLRVEGTRNIPKSGSVLVVANHAHNIDPVLLAAAYPRLLHVMAKAELFRNRAFGALMTWLGAFPVNRGKADRTAIRRGFEVLDAGLPLGMFPEGTRSRSGRLGAGQPGAGLFAVRPGVTILPVAIIGSQRLPGGGQRARGFHRPVRVVYGVPFQLERAATGKSMASTEATARIMSAINELLPPDQQYDAPSTATASTETG